MAWVFNPFTGKLDFTNTGGGGGGTPGGSSGQVQYNNGGAFGGMSGTTWTDASQSLAIASTGAGTGVTTSSPVLNLTQTWNDGAVTFSGIKLNVTASASAGGSKLLDIQQGGSPLVLVTSGNGPSLRVSNVSAQYGNQFMTDYGNWYLGGSVSEASGTVSSSALVFQSSSGIKIRSSHAYGWVSSTDATAAADLVLTRAAAATLQLGAADAAAPVAQTFQVQSVVAGTSNTAGANFTINGSRGTGTGPGGSIIFQVAPAVTTGSAQNAYSTALTIDSNKNLTFTGGGTLQLGSANSQTMLTSRFGKFYFGGASDGDTTASSWFLNAGNVTLSARSTGIFGFTSSSTDASAPLDVILVRDTTSTLALRNGNSTGAAQRFNVYNTYTSSTNYETFKIDWITTANTCLIGTEKGSGGGTARSLALQTDGTTRLTLTTDGQVQASGILTAGSYISTPTEAYCGTLIVRPTNDAYRNAITHDALGVIAQRSGTTAQAFKVYGSYTSATNYQRLAVTTVRESSGALSGATYVSTIAIPAYAVLIGVTTRVTTAVTGATSYSVGDGTTANLWGNNIGIALNSQSQTSDFTAVGAVGAAATSRTVTLTANGSNFTGGVVEICLHYLTTEAD